MDRVQIFVDGSLYQKTGQAGIGAVIINKSKGTYREITRKVTAKNNTTVELMAAVVALESVKTGALVDLYTDCRYVTDAIVPHGDLDHSLWKRMATQSEKHHIAFFHIPRDRGDVLQHRSHELAQKGALGEPSKYNVENSSLDKGSTTGLQCVLTQIAKGVDCGIHPVYLRGTTQVRRV